MHKVEEVYLSLNGKEFEKIKEKGKKNATNEWGTEGEHDFLFPSLGLKVDTAEYPEFKDGSMRLDGELRDGEADLGYLSVEFDLDLDTVIAIIEHYMKRLGKLKTVLEATK